MVLKDVQPLSQIATDRQKDARAERLREEERGREGMDALGQLAKNLVEKSVTDRYLGIDQRRKFEIEKEKLDYQANIEAQQKKAKEERTVKKETRAARGKYAEAYAKAAAARKQINAQSSQKAIEILMKHASSSQGSSQFAAASQEDYNAKITAATKQLQSLAAARKPGQGESKQFKDIKDNLNFLIMQQQNEAEFLTSPAMQKTRTAFSKSGLKRADRLKILAENGLLDKWREHMGDAYTAEMLLNKALFNSVRQGTDNRTLPQFVNDGIRARQGSEEKPLEDYRNSEMQEVVFNAGEGLYDGDNEPGVVTGPTGSSRSGLTKKRPRGAKSNDVAERGAAVTKQVDESNYLLRNYEEPGKKSKQLKRPYSPAEVDIKVDGWIKSIVGNDSVASDGVRMNYGMQGLGTELDTKFVGKKVIIKGNYAQMLKDKIAGDTAAYGATKEFRNSIIAMRQTDAIQGILNDVLSREETIKRLKSGTPDPIVIDAISAKLVAKGMSPDLNKELSKESTDYEAALKAVMRITKKPAEDVHDEDGVLKTAGVEPNEVYAYIMYKSVMGVQDLKDYKEALKAKPISRVLVEGESVVVRGEPSAQLDLMKPDHMTKFIDDQLAAELRSNNTGFQASKAVALGRRTITKRLKTRELVRREYRNSLERISSSESVMALIDDLYANVGEDGTVDAGTFKVFRKRLRAALGAGINNNNIMQTLKNIGLRD